MKIYYPQYTGVHREGTHEYTGKVHRSTQGGYTGVHREGTHEYTGKVHMNTQGGYTGVHREGTQEYTGRVHRSTQEYTLPRLTSVTAVESLPPVYV